MQLASCTVKLTPLNEVHKPSVTPAEVYILRHIHQRNAGGDAVHSLVLHLVRKHVPVRGKKSKEVVTKDPVDYQPKPGREAARLKAKYGKEPVQGGVFWFEKFYPGANPVLPETFDEVAYRAPEQAQAGEASTRDTLPGEPGHGDNTGYYIPPSESKAAGAFDEFNEVEEPTPAGEGETKDLATVEAD